MAKHAVNHRGKTQIFNIIIKSILGIVFLSLLYFLTKSQTSIREIYNAFIESLDASRIYLLFIVALMMCVNWGLESIKWQRLLVPVEPTPFPMALRGVLVGLSTALFTPNRVGEYLGRAWLMPKGKRWKAAAALMLGSFIQMVLISLVGLAALMHLLHLGEVLPILNSSWQQYLLLVAILLALVSYYYAGAIITWMQARFPDRWVKWTRQLAIYQEYHLRDLSGILVLTLVRMLIYAIQYLLLLRFFGIHVEWTSSLAAIMACYFIQTSMPIPPFVALLARGEIALLIWDYFEVNELSVLSASYSLWVINVLIPSLVGMIFVLKMDILKSLGYGSS